MCVCVCVCACMQVCVCVCDDFNLLCIFMYMLPIVIKNYGFCSMPGYLVVRVYITEKHFLFICATPL